MVIKSRCPSLKIIFLEYLVVMAAAAALAMLIPFSLYSIGMNVGWFTYANSAEIQAKSAKPIITDAQKFDSNLVPASSRYVYLNADGTVQESNMEEAEQSNAINFSRGEYTPASPDDCYLLIQRSDGICVLHYYIRSYYQASWMNGRFPSPDITLIVIIVLNCLLACFLVTTLFASRLKKQLQPLMQATKKVREQDLDFDIQPSKIKEFQTILLSIDEMKTELKQSLEKQWRLEQARREQTSALAHDIKTPLTIIRGNAELLDDSVLTEEQRDYTRYILKNADRMEQYLRMLIDLTKTQTGCLLNRQIVSTASFLQELTEQTNGLASAHQVSVNYQWGKLPEEFMADTVLLRRALMNILSNAADYAGEHGMITLSAQEEKGRICFCVTDSGKGFSPQALKQAAEQFYRGDVSRSSQFHYGMGLYIAKSIVEQHEGTLSIANSPLTGGGQVTVEIPVG